MTRRPAVAGMFYPAEPRQLKQVLDEIWPAPGLPPVSALAAVSPHAGYVYSGKVAARTIARCQVPGSVIVLGPNHRGLGAPAAIMTEGSWLMPDGKIDLDQELGEAVLARSRILEKDALAHVQEHSLEVQLPFLRRVNPEFKLTPIALSRSDLSACRDIGSAMAQAIEASGRPALIVASTDMTHYEAQEMARLKDRQAIDRILELDPEGLYRVVTSQGITMCGVIPTVCALYAALDLGARQAELIQYTTSGETSGDYSQVVGYAGLIIT